MTSAGANQAPGRRPDTTAGSPGDRPGKATYDKPLPARLGPDLINIGWTFVGAGKQRRRVGESPPPPPPTTQERMRRGLTRTTPAVIALGAVSICVLVLVVIFGRAPLVVGAEPMPPDQPGGATNARADFFPTDRSRAWLPVTSATPTFRIPLLPPAAPPTQTTPPGQWPTRPAQFCREAGGSSVFGADSSLVVMPTEDPPTTDPPTTEPPTTEPPTTEPPTTEPPTTEPPTTEPPTTEPPTTEPPTTTPPPTTRPPTTSPWSPPPTSGAPPTYSPPPGC